MKSAVEHIIRSKLESQKGLLNSALIKSIERAADIFIDSLQRGNKVLVCGNGGSAADAQHFVTELVVRFQRERRAMPAIALTTNTSILTAAANDYTFERIFERQVEALGIRGDVLLAISTSGNSGNVFAACVLAREKGLRTIGLSGSAPSPLHEVVELAISAPGKCTAEIQESHIIIIHTLCELIEERCVLPH